MWTANAMAFVEATLFSEVTALPPRSSQLHSSEESTCGSALSRTNYEPLLGCK